MSEILLPSGIPVLVASLATTGFGAVDERSAARLRVRTVLGILAKSSESYGRTMRESLVEYLGDLRCLDDLDPADRIALFDLGVRKLPAL
jgi:hypothetical protein